MNLNLLKESFVGFIRARGMGRHFDRLGMDMFRSAPLTKEVPQTLAQSLLASSQADIEQLLQQLHSSGRADRAGSGRHPPRSRSE